MLRGMQDLHSPTREIELVPPRVDAQSSNHWAAREFLELCFYSLSFTLSRSLLKFMSIEVVIPSNHPILCHSLLLPSIFTSIRVFSNELALCIRWPKNWSFRFSISPSSEYSGLISLRIDWVDLCRVMDSVTPSLQ